MKRQKKPSSQSVKLTIGGNIVNGQVAIGSNICMKKSVVADKAEERLLQIEELKAQVKKDAPPELEREALEKISDLAVSIGSLESDRSEIETIRAWFVERIPALKEKLEVVITKKT